MKKVITTAVRHPLWILSITTILTIAALLQVPQLQFEVSTRGMMVDDQQALDHYAKTRETFGNENVTVVYLQDADLFAPGKLLAIQAVLNSIEAIPEVKKTVSLFSLRHLRTIDEYVYTNAYLDRIPETREAAQEIKAAALENPLVKDNLLSADGNVMAINVYLDVHAPSQNMNARLTLALDAAIEPLQSQLDRVFHIGDPSIKSGIMARINADQKVILPLASLVLLVTLGLILRRASGVLVPLMTASLSVIWILGFMAALGIPISVLTAIVPALIIIIGSTEDIHLMTEYQAALQRGLKPQRALLSMARHKSTAVTLTFTSTCIGFLAIALNRIDLLAQFGLVTAMGLLLNFLITVTLVPICVQWCKQCKFGNSAVRTDGFESVAERISDFTFRYAGKIIPALLGIMVLGAIFAADIRVNNNEMGYFDPNSDLPKQAQLLHENLSGLKTLSLVVEGPENAFLEISALQSLQNLQHYIDATGKFDKTLSFADFIGVIHAGLSDTPSPGLKLPGSSAAVEEYIGLIGETANDSFVSTDLSQSRIFVRHAIASSTELNQAVADIYNYAHNNLDANLTVRITGASYLSSQASDYIISGQLISLLAMLAMIFLLVIVLFKNPRAAFTAVVANLFPIVVLFGTLGYFNIPLDTGTTMVAAISLGICIDHSIHFLMRYQTLLNEGYAGDEILRRVVRHESTPIIATALALTMGFITLAFSSFPPIAHFGLLSAMVMLLALISTFVILPLMMRSYRFNVKIIPQKEIASY